MKACVIVLLVSFAPSIATSAQRPQSPQGAAAPHVAAAKAAAGSDHLALFNNICSPPPPVQSQPGGQAAVQPQGPPPRSEWYVPPGTTEKLPMIRQRRPGQPHPYVIGNDSVSRFLVVAEECAKAGPLW